MFNDDFLVFQAKSFYNAHTALDQINRQSDDLMYYIPTIVSGAFSCELTLKAILSKNNIKYENGHNLLMLFELLPSFIKSEIWERLIQKAPEYNETGKFLDELILISNAFTEWRYAFEGNPVPAFDLRFLSAFANATAWTMLSHYNVSLERSDIGEINDEEIEKKIKDNREKCKESNIKKLQKRK